MEVLGFYGGLLGGSKISSTFTLWVIVWIFIYLNSIGFKLLLDFTTSSKWL